MQVSITIDMEHDCLSAPKTFRGVADGTPQLLRLFRERDVKATFFTTGEVARQFPDTVRAIVAAGHELGCHSDTHARFSTIDRDEAKREIDDSTATLRAFFPLTSFRAPNLDFPDDYLTLLRDAGYALNSSQARYKKRSLFWGPTMAEGHAPHPGLDHAVGGAPAAPGAARRARAAQGAGRALFPSVGIRRHDAGADSLRLPLPHRRAGAALARGQYRLLPGTRGRVPHHAGAGL